MTDFKFNKNKAIASLLYIAKKLSEDGIKTDMHAVFKILYFAEKMHLATYARPIAGDDYIAMQYGPVPSKIYDMVKAVREENWFFHQDIKGVFKMDGLEIIPIENPDMDELSESDLFFIDQSLKENKCLPFDERTIKSHGSAWANTPEHSKMDFCDMAKEGGAPPEMCDIIRLNSENEHFFDYL